MPENNDAAQVLTTGALRLAEAAAQKQKESNHPQFGVNHWLLALLERHGPMAETMVQGMQSGPLLRQLDERLEKGELGEPLDQDTVARKAYELAQARGKAQATERDVARVILGAAGFEVAKEGAAFVAPSSYGAAPGAVKAGGGEAPAAGSRTPRPTPTLEQFGRDLTREASEGKLPPVVGRDEETDLVIETLCRRTKRNPVLVGPAGVGKTAIVEGLAQRIQRGEVPEALRGVRVLAIQPSTLVAGAGVVGELQQRMKAILAEANQDGVMLFIDEVHSIIGAGGAAGTGDVASLLKPALARGDLACIAATTDDEYRRFIEPDAALERRFQPVRVQELTAAQTLEILKGLRDDFARARGVQTPDPVLEQMVDFAQQYLRNRYFPDKAVDLLEQCVAHAVAHGRKEVEPADARDVVQRMVGMPLALGDRIEVLRKELCDRALLTDADTEALLKRLEVTLRGLDLRPARPSAVVLLLGEAGFRSEGLANTIAECLFGAAERVVTLDFSRFTEHHHVSFLIGAPPGYVGYSDELPLHRVAQMPWCVLRAENIHACHPQVLEVFTQALASGFITDARGKRVYLSDAVVLLTAAVERASRRTVGFRHEQGPAEEAARESAEKLLGPAILGEVDLVCSEVLSSDASRKRWLEKHLLSDLAERYRKQGLEVAWDTSLVEWLLSQQDGNAGERDWERLVDQELSPALIAYIPGAGQVAHLDVRCEGGSLQVAVKGSVE